MNAVTDVGSRLFLDNDLRSWVIAAAQFAVWFTVLPLLRAFITRRVKALAITATKRHPDFPEVPTMTEAGVQGFDRVGAWFGIVAPKGTPKAAVETLNQALVKALATPALKEKLAKLGATPLDPTLPAFATRLDADRRAWEPVLNTVDLKAQ